MRTTFWLAVSALVHGGLAAYFLNPKAEPQKALIEIRFAGGNPRQSQEHSHKENQSVDLSFVFEVISYPLTRGEEESRSQVIGNVLTFYRGYFNSDLEWHLGPFQGYWFAPLVNLDPAWIIEHLEKYMNGRDPMQDFKN